MSRNGSDLLLVAEAPASIRLEGQLVTVGPEPLTGDEIEAAVLPALAIHARQRLPTQPDWGLFLSSRGFGALSNQPPPGAGTHRGYGAGATLKSSGLWPIFIFRLEWPDSSQTAARVGDHWRSDRIRQDHDAGGLVNEINQAECAPHCHH